LTFKLFCTKRYFTRLAEHFNVLCQVKIFMTYEHTILLYKSTKTDSPVSDVVYARERVIILMTNTNVFFPTGVYRRQTSLREVIICTQVLNLYLWVNVQWVLSDHISGADIDRCWFNKAIFFKTYLTIG